MKIGRNELCLCGSGIKYKKCCLNKTAEKRLSEAIMYSMESIERNARIKQCLHPNQKECDQKIVKAHAIQNNRILNKIAEEGHVITMDGTSDLFFQGMQIKGRKIATTFTGFCKYHDKVLFQAIEDKGYLGSEEQIFMLTYRTMAWHYHKKMEQINAAFIRYKKMYERGYDLTDSEELRKHIYGLNLAARDNAKEKNTFDRFLLNGSYNKVNFCTWEIPYEVDAYVTLIVVHFQLKTN